MIKQSEPPITQRRFANTWSELDYLCGKVRYWLFTRKKRPRAERFRVRLEKTLRALPNEGIAILREEGLALLHQLKGEFHAAIAHREREIWLMEQLHAEANSNRYSPNTKAYMLRDRGLTDLVERRVLLESLRNAQAAQKLTGLR